MTGLVVRGLTVELPGAGRVVDGVDVTVAPGRVLALVGPSGAGKSLTVRAVARLLPAQARVGGAVHVGGVDVLGAGAGALRRLRGTALGCVFQNPTASLNPTMTVGRHLLETLRAHDHLPRAQRRARGIAALTAAGLDDAGAIWAAHPFELSGGQAQRVAIALATVCGPAVLLADEITSELDAVTQAGVLDTVRAQAAGGTGVLLVTHDLGTAARWADDIVVLEAGRVVEHGEVYAVLGAPQASLTRRLVDVARRSSVALGC